jgi:predicted phosphoribosyltransferase
MEFHDVGQYYKYFDQLNDNDVQRMLAEVWGSPKKGNGDKK